MTSTQHSLRNLNDIPVLYPLIDRLQICSELKYPERKWTIDTYYAIAFEWIGKIDKLKERLLELETELNIEKNG